VGLLGLAEVAVEEPDAAEESVEPEVAFEDDELGSP